MRTCQLRLLEKVYQISQFWIEFLFFLISSCDHAPLYDAGSFGQAILVKSVDDKRHYIAKTIKLSKLSARDLGNCQKEVWLDETHADTK